MVNVINFLPHLGKLLGRPYFSEVCKKLVILNGGGDACFGVGVLPLSIWVYSL